MRALVGHTGFVGTNLKRQTSFDFLFDSKNVGNIGGRSYDFLVCAAAPAAMWAANNDPEADLANISTIIDHLGAARIGRLVLISTIAVLDQAGAGYTETDCRYETTKAYGRNRRHLEVEAARLADRVHVLRLPALYGAGLKKNFIFDTLNPIPSFLKRDKFEKLLQQMLPAEADAVSQVFVFDLGMDIFRLDRERLQAGNLDGVVASALDRLGFSATHFTNSESKFQYYSLSNLWADVERVVANDIDTLHLAVEPLAASEIHQALTGRAFVSNDAPIYLEDMHSCHSADWGREGPYLYSADTTLKNLTEFYRDALGNR